MQNAECRMQNAECELKIRNGEALAVFVDLDSHFHNSQFSIFHSAFCILHSAFRIYASDGPISSSACAAARRATGTRYGEQET
jgi:hypothetical protein